MELNHDTQNFLRRELTARIARNPKYSLRSFAAFLELSPSFLSKLMNGKRALTPAVHAKVSAKLALPTLTQTQEPNFKRVELDQFSFIADWYHFAILEYVAIPDADTSAKAVARAFGISLHEAQDAIDRLIRLDFLARDRKDRLTNRSGNNTTIGPNIATPATRTQQKQILEKAIDALDTIAIEDRSQTSVTLAIPHAKLEDARKLIAKFRRQMTSLLQDPNSDPDSVYQLSVSLYPLTKPQTKPRTHT